MSKDFDDSKYGQRETARFNAGEAQKLGDAQAVFNISKSDALRHGPEALLLVPQVQSKISQAQSVLSDLQLLLNAFIANIRLRDSSSMTLSDARPSMCDRRQTFVRQKVERRASCGS